MNPDTDDWKKLVRLLTYLECTKDDTLTLGSNNCCIVKWWIDGSYAVHPDYRSQTGGTMSMGTGSIYSTSQKQKINTKSSTETEVVATDDVLPQVIWTMYFLTHQGYKCEHIVMQDNESAIKLEENGQASSGKRTRHMNVRYFFIKDRIDSGEIKVEHCSTDLMRGDFFTKPLQGYKFRFFKALIMGHEIPPKPIARPSSPRSVLDSATIPT